MALPSPDRPLRAQVLEALRQRPGLTATELARDLGVHHSSAAYHLGRLERRGLVIRLRHRGRVHAFLVGAQGPRDRARVVLDRSASGAQVLAHVAAEPRRLGAIARGVPMTKAAVYWHLERLARLGLVVMEGPPRVRTYRLPAATAMVQPVAPAFNPAAVAG